LGRPRDIIAICSKLSPFSSNIDPKKFREIVNDTASSEIVANSFDEVAFLLHSIRKKDDRTNFLSLIHTNILTLDELKNICREFNDISTCDHVECKHCDKSHPFCDLYNAGLIGTLKRDTTSDDQYKEYIMKFLGPYDKHIFCKGSIIKSNFYLIHPALHENIAELRNRRLGKKYNLVDHVLIGHNYTWTSRCTALKEINFLSSAILNPAIVEKISINVNDILDDNKTKEEKISIVKKMKNFIGEPSQYSDHLTKILKLVDRLVTYSERLTM